MGRRRMLLVTQLGVLIFGIACAYSPTLLLYWVTRFVCGWFVFSSFSTAFVYRKNLGEQKLKNVYFPIFFILSDGSDSWKVEKYHGNILSSCICSWIHNSLRNGLYMERMEAVTHSHVFNISTIFYFVDIYAGITEVRISLIVTKSLGTQTFTGKTIKQHSSVLIVQTSAIRGPRDRFVVPAELTKSKKVSSIHCHFKSKVTRKLSESMARQIGGLTVSVVR